MNDIFESVSLVDNLSHKCSKFIRIIVAFIICALFLALPHSNVYGMPFNSAVNYSVGSSPRSVAVGYFNGDTNLDLAVANYGSDNVSILLGVGDGTFGAAVNYAVGTWPDSVAVGDFNSDNKTDLAVANENSNNVSILLGVGDGTFGTAVNYGAGTSPSSVAVGDFNGGGILDLAVANNGTNNVSILLGVGDGTFGAAVNYNVGSGPTSVAVDDFNGDTNLDLAVANYTGNNVSILLGVGDGTFGAAVNYAAGTGASSVAVGNFNSDNTDLAVANYGDNNVSILLGAGDGTFGAAVNYGAGLGSTSVAVDDFNGDGKSDLAVVNYGDNNVSILLGYGDGTFSAPVNYNVGTWPLSVAVGDFNGDSNPDLAVVNVFSDNVSILINTSAIAPTFTSAATNTAGTTITITFSKNMADPAGKQAEFSYKVNGGLAQTFSAAAFGADNTRIDLTCSGTGIVYGDNVTVSYAKGTVLAADGNVLESFTDQPVTNNLPVPPTFVSAATNTTGTIITITFSKNMADPAGKQAEFSYKVNAGLAQTFSAAALNADNTKIDLTCSGTAIVFGDTVTVSYTKGTVLAADGGVLASFTDQPVTNNMPGPPTFVSAATNTAGTIITIIFSKNMADPAGKQAEFSYKVNAGPAQTFSAAAFGSDNTRIDLTCSGTAIVYGDNVTVSYTLGTVLAADGGILASFTDQPVTNNMPGPPTFVSAATNTAGTIITITFSKNIADPAGKQAEFSYKVNAGLAQTFSVAALNADNTKIDLTCSGTTIVFGDTITVSYTLGTVLAADGGILASFTDQPVTNNMVAPPTFVSAATNTAGTVITITFSKNMADPAGKQAEFSYKVNAGPVQTLSAAALNADNTKIDLNCSGTAVVYGDNVTVSYTKGTVLAADGGVLASFTDQPVTNNMVVPPTFVSAATNTAGTIITISFSKNMADPAGKQAEFSYKVNAGPAQTFSAAVLNADNTKIDLTCSGIAIVYGDNVTVSYAKGTVVAADGGVLASFTDQPVTNNLPVPPPTFISATTNTAGTVITITFSKNTDPAGKQAEFSYKVNAGLAQTFSAAAFGADNTRIDLTCSGTAIVYGDTVTVSYTKGTVLAADGGVLASFTDQPVTNNLPGPPTFVSAATNTTGTIITITFSKNMADPAGKQAEFSYKVNAGLAQTFSAAAFGSDNTRIDLTCSGTAIVYGDTVTVSYTLGTVLAADGGILASFADRPVTNNMPGPPTFVSAATNTAGTVITIIFSKNMADPAGKQAEFSYKVNAGPAQTFSAAAFGSDNTRIDLTCSGTAIVYGDNVTVSYTLGTVLAADGGILASFTDQPVTNNMPGPPTFVSAATNTTGTIITITFSKNMADPAGKQAEFSYKVNGGLDQTFSSAALNADNTRIDLTCSGTAIVYGNVVTVSYTLGTVLAADGTVLASFIDRPVINTIQLLQSSQQVNTATGTGTAIFTANNGSITGLTATVATTCGTLPGFIFPHGFFSFNIINITPGSMVTITINLPLNMPLGTRYWKCLNGQWVDCSSLLGDNNGDNVLTLTITDGGLGDADGVANGTIVDPGGPAYALAAAEPAVPRGSSLPPNWLKPAEMSLKYLNVNPKEASANQPVTIITNVVNTGNEAGNYEVVLKINGQVEQTKTVGVGAQGTQPVKFTITKAQPGTYAVDIGGQTGSFTVLSTRSAGAFSNSWLIVVLIICALIVVTVVVLRFKFRRAAQKSKAAQEDIVNTNK